LISPPSSGGRPTEIVTDNVMKWGTAYLSRAPLFSSRV
jgi:hypothetical protein